MAEPQSTEANNLCGDDLSESQEIFMSQAYDLLVDGVDVNNDLLNSDDESEFMEEDEMEGYEEGDDILVINEEVPSLEFTNIECIEKAVVDSSDFSGQASGASDIDDLYVGQRFSTKEQLQNAVKTFSIKAHQEYEVAYSTPSLWVLKCKQAPQCPWRLRASISKRKSEFEIKKYGGPHTCVNPIINQDHAQLDSRFIANQIKALVKAQMSITLTAIQAEICDKFNYTISKKKSWLAKKKAITELFGDWLESYKVLPKYMDMLKHTNPGTIVHWDKEPRGGNSSEESFKRVFWAFAASIEGFKHCRPVISIDGTFLYGKYKGTMLIAVSADANNQLFPLAFAIVESENKQSWLWFMACLREFVTQRTGICVISDRHPGILATMKEVGSGWTEPLAYHCYCIRHLASNFNDKFHDKVLKDLVSSAARENQDRKFKKRMETIGRINADARIWLDELPIRKWTLSHDGGKRYGMMTTNLSEIFNSVLKGARSLPVTSLVQLTFYRVNSYFALRRQFAAQRILEGQHFTPYVDGKLISCGIKAGRHEVILFNRVAGTFSIQTGRSLSNIRKGGHVQIVKLSENKCSCQKWQIYGFPCSHVLAACQHCSLDYKPFVENWYSLSTYEKTWAPLFHPIPDKAYWLPNSERELTLVPHDSMKRSEKGRPKSTRIHNEMDAKEGKGSVACGICKETGHNKRTCSKRKQ